MSAYACNAEVLKGDELSTLSDLLFCWQYTSAILAGGFCFFSNFYWQLVIRYQDQRYLVSALTAHLIWLISWIAISLPLVSRWQRWETSRGRAVADILVDQARPANEREQLAQALTDLRPGGFGTLLLSAALAVASFVFPIVKELWHF